MNKHQCFADVAAHISSHANAFRKSKKEKVPIWGGGQGRGMLGIEIDSTRPWRPMEAPQVFVGVLQRLPRGAGEPATGIAIRA